MEIAALFESGNSFLVYPLKVIWSNLGSEKPTPAQVAFTVSRKLFRSAVRRNRIKRLIREAYRLNKHLLYSLLAGQKISCVIVYVGRHEEPYSLIEKSMKISLKKIANNLVKPV